MLLLAAGIAFISVFATAGMGIYGMAKEAIKMKNAQMLSEGIAADAKTIAMLGEGSIKKYETRNLHGAKIIQRGEKCELEISTQIGDKTKSFSINGIFCPTTIEIQGKTPIKLEKNSGKVIASG